MREEKVTLDSIRSNYKKESDIQEELKNVNIGNHLEFNYHRNYVFRKCAYCDGPILRYLPTKCPKLDYDEKVVKKFESYLKNIGGFSEAVERREKSYWRKELT